MNPEIHGPEALAELFTMLHDGVLSAGTLEDRTLTLEVEILYLAERIDPSFDSFTLRLWPVTRLEFRTWPPAGGAPPRILDDPREIFLPEFEILSAKVEDDLVLVSCTQDRVELGYGGGLLAIAAETAQITDPAGRAYSLESVASMCRAYWDEWESGETS